MSRKKNIRKKGKSLRGPGQAKLKPISNPDKLFAEAVQLVEVGELAEARKHSLRLARQFPQSIEIKQLLGTIFLHGQEPVKAAEIFRNALELFPRSAELNDLLGVALMESGQVEDATASFRRALLVNPRGAGTLNNLGNAFKLLQRLDEAAAAFKESLDYRPNDVGTLHNFGNVLFDLGDFSRAEEIYRRILRVSNIDPDVLIDLAAALQLQKKFPEAIECLESALEHDGNKLLIYHNQALVFGAMGELEKSGGALSKALDINPDHPPACMTKSIHHFLKGEWSQAWAPYEARWAMPDNPRRPFEQPLWEGQDLKGKTLLVWGEQGAGDEIMFASMIPGLLKLGAEVIFEADPRLVPLFKRSFPDIECVGREDPPHSETRSPEISYQSPSGNLGRWLRADEQSFSGGAAFLKADSGHVQSLKARYRSNGKLVIGLAWDSGASESGAVKSIPIASLMPLVETPGVQFVDLQYGDVAAQRDFIERETGVEIFNDPEIDQMSSIDDFASQVAAMDLVITISNTTAHVSGALGVLTWEMLNAIPDRRWMMERSDSPWYQSIKLFRQSSPGEWGPVIEDVCMHLSRLLEQRGKAAK